MSGIALAVLAASLTQCIPSASKVQTSPTTTIAQAAETKRAADSQPATFRVAAIQFISTFGDPQDNIHRLVPLIRQAAGQGAKVVVLPEAAITGYTSFDLNTTWQAKGRTMDTGKTGVSPASVAESADGPTVRSMATLAGELGIYLTIPFVEIDARSGRYFNTVILAGPDGKLLLHYQKLNPWPPAEDGWTTKGDLGHQYIDTPYGRLGLLICFDIFGEVTAMQAAHVDTLLFSIAWADTPGGNFFDEGLLATAKDNGFNVVAANWTVPVKPDWHGYGQSEIIAFDGTVLARVKNDLATEIIYADLPRGGIAWREKKPGDE